MQSRNYLQELLHGLFLIVVPENITSSQVILTHGFRMKLQEGFECFAHVFAV